MKTKTGLLKVVITTLLALGLMTASAVDALAHCDTLDGPVVSTAQAALDKGDVTPILKWVKKENEGEIREAFVKTLAVRAKGREAKELADRYFFETLVRIHRAGEGAPFTGLKPAGQDFGPAISGADRAIETGSAADLEKLITGDVAQGIRTRFNKVIETKKHAGESVEAGRAYVAAYVDYVHFAERIHQAVEKGSAHHGGESAEAEENRSHHE
jgi:hypothetical protein